MDFNSALPVAADIADWLSRRGNKNSKDPIDGLLLAGQSLIGCEAVGVYWQATNELVVPIADEPIDSLQAQLGQRLRHSLWPWLLAQPAAEKQITLNAPEELISDLATRVTLVPILNHRQRIGGFLAFAGELTLHRDWADSPVDPLVVFRDVVRHRFMAVTDPDTALLHREAFVSTVNTWIKEHTERGDASQLLILDMDSLIDVELAAGVDAGRAALSECIGLLETRIRSRDVVGRVSRHAIAVLLRRCTQEMSGTVSKALYECLAQHRFSWNSNIFPTHCHLSVQRLQAGDDIEALLPPIAQVSRNPSKIATSDWVHTNNVVTLTTARFETAERNNPTGAVRDFPESNLRAQPGVLLQDLEVTACYRLRVLGEVRDDDGMVLGDHSHCHAALTQITAEMTLQQRSLLPVLIIDVPGTFIEQANLEWLLTQCIELRVPMSTFCLAFSEAALFNRLREALPVLKRAHREGVQLMMKAPGESPYAYHLQKKLPLDYIELLPTLVQSAVSSDFERAIVKAQITVAHSLGLQVTCANLDSMQSIKFCSSMGIDIGFGKLCGRSVSLSALGMDNLSNG